MKEGMQTILQEMKLPYQLHQAGSLLTLFFTRQSVHSFADVQTCDVTLFERYFRYLYDHGILIAPSPYEAMFLSTAHTYEELDHTLQIVRSIKTAYMSQCVQLSLQGVAVLVIGGGRIAYRKCCQLEQEGAELVVIAKQFDACFQGAAYPCITDSYRPQQLREDAGHLPAVMFDQQ